MKRKATMSLRPLCLAGAALALGVVTAGPAQAGLVTLNLIDSYNRTGAFGLAFDGVNLWYNGSTGIHEMTTAGVDTGNSTPWVGGVGSLSALAWTGTQLAGGVNVIGPSGTVALFDPITGGNLSLLTLTGGGGDHSPFDGLDFDGGEWWYSPDGGAVYRNDGTGSLVGPSPFVAAGAGHSGVERVFDHILTVDFGSNPRSLCVYGLDQSFVGCGSLLGTGTHYEDLAFDGRYLWAADLSGKINKYDVLVDGHSILVPEPASLLLVAVGLGGLAGVRRRKKA